MNKQQVRYIVKRNYNTTRTVTDAFINLIKKDKNKNIKINQYNIDKNNKSCYTEGDFKEDCIFSVHSKEE